MSKKSKKLAKIAKIDEKSLQIIWLTWWISMKFSGKISLMIILKVIKISTWPSPYKHNFGKATWGSFLGSIYLDHRSKESILLAENSIARKETVDIDILVTYRNGERKIMQPIRITSGPTTSMTKWNQFNQFWWKFTKVRKLVSVILYFFTKW